MYEIQGKMKDGYDPPSTSLNPPVQPENCPDETDHCVCWSSNEGPCCKCGKRPQKSAQPAQPVAENWYFISINPEGWAVGPLGVKRANNKLIPYMGRNQQLHDFKEAVKEELNSKYVNLPTDEEVELLIYVWQKLDMYDSATGRRTRDKYADLTNIVKAVEDAIQGVLIRNDKKVMAQRNVIVERSENTEGCIAICVRRWHGLNPDELPQSIWGQVDIQKRDPDIGTNALNVDQEIPF